MEKQCLETTNLDFKPVVYWNGQTTVAVMRFTGNQIMKNKKRQRQGQRQHLRSYLLETTGQY